MNPNPSINHTDRNCGLHEREILPKAYSKKGQQNSQPTEGPVCMHVMCMYVVCIDRQ